MSKVYSAKPKSAECELKKYYRAIFYEYLEMDVIGLASVLPHLKIYRNIRGMSEYDHMPTEDELMGDMMTYKCRVGDKIEVEEFYKIVEVE